MVEGVVENTSDAVHLQHVVDALRILVGECEAGHLVIIIRVVRLRVGNHHLLATVTAHHLTVDDVHHIHLFRAEKIVGPVGHRRVQDARVGLERASLLNLVVPEVSPNACRGALVLRTHLMGARAVDVFPHTEGVVELQDRCTVGFREIHLETLAAAAGCHSIGRQLLVLGDKVVRANVDAGIGAAVRKSIR